MILTDDFDDSDVSDSKPYGEIAPRRKTPAKSSSSSSSKPKKDKKDKNHGDDGKVKEFPTKVKHEGNWVHFKKQCDRVKNELYLDSNSQVSIWLSGDAGWHCPHNRQRSQCKACGGSQICEHGRVRSQCKDCGGSQICEHRRVRSRCHQCRNDAAAESSNRAINAIEELIRIEPDHPLLNIPLSEYKPR